jgi:hypothetical protein
MARLRRIHLRELQRAAALSEKMLELRRLQRQEQDKKIWKKILKFFKSL